MVELVVPILVNASVIALVALAFHVVIRATGGIADFSVGQYVIIAGLTSATTAQLGLPLVLAAFLGLLAACFVGLVNELVVIRRLVAASASGSMLVPVVATVSLLWIWEQLARLVFGDFPIRGPALIDGTFAFRDLAIPRHSIVVIALALVGLFSIQMWLARTKTGRALRAIGDNRMAAELLGFRVERTRALAFVVAGALAGVAGIIASPLAGFRPLGGAYYTLNGFVALFLGGATRPAGAFVGALLLEALKIVMSRYVGSGYQDYVVFAIALLIFSVRPQGLLPPPAARRA
jgi:branched-chain amino acid transport system permease protein